jgi:nitrite reductase (NADH) small subunit
VTCPPYFVIELESGRAVAPHAFAPAKVENGMVWLSVRQPAAVGWVGPS